jgi:hypothetical protein
MRNNFYKNGIKENDIIKEIVSKYYYILNNKNIINEDYNLVKLSSTGYSNLKYDKDGTQNDSVNKPLLDDINSAAKSVGVVATITTAKTGHNRTVKGSKSISRHMNGTGVDVAILDGIGSGGASNSTNGLEKFRNLGFKLKNALVSMGYTWNTERGNDKAVLWHTNTGGNHYNHLHISNKTGVSSAPPTNNSKEEVTEPTKVDGTVINKLIYDSFSKEEKKTIESVLTKLKADGITNIYTQIVFVSIVLWKLGDVEDSDDDVEDSDEYKDIINDLPSEIKIALKGVEDCFNEKITSNHIKLEKSQEGVDYYPDNGGIDPNAKKSLLKLLSAFALKYPEVKKYTVVSDWRSYTTQIRTFCKKPNSEKKISDRQKWSALPGFSQHSTGKTFDLFSTEPGWWNSRPELKNWLKDNAPDYGFKVSYPSKGVLRESEPWHIYYTGGSIKESVEIDSDVEGLMTSVKTEDFKSLEECLNYFDKKLNNEDFNKEEVKKIAEKFVVSVNDENNKKSEINLDKLKQFFKKFDEIYGEKKEDINEDIIRMKNIMKKLL